MVALRAVVLFLSLTFIHAKVLDLSCKQIREVVDGHNSRRLLVARGQVAGQPAASKMTSMVWDEELANKAAQWASHNKFQHNPDRSIPSKRFKTGENIYIFSTTEANYQFNLDSALESWFEEHKHYRYKPLTPADFQGPDIGHYTQMVWSESMHVGCALSQYPQNGWNNFLVVCNYGPAGNFLSKKPYPSGQACNALVCGTSNCSRPYGEKCSRVTSLRSIFRNSFGDYSSKSEERQYY